MSPAAGWFPDPDGTPGRLRYWDGTGWTQQTSVGSPTVSTPPESKPGRPGRSGVVAVAIVVCLAVIVGVVVAVRALRDTGTEITDNPPQASTTRSAYDDGASPTPTPSTSPSRSATPVQPDPSGERPASCDETRADELPPPPQDGRVHGGPLSYPQNALPDWTGPTSEARIPYGRDAWMLYRVVTSETRRGWQSSAVVGVTAFEKYPGTQDAANTILQCVITSSLYLNMDVKISSSTAKATKIDGTGATRVDAVISFDDPDLKTKGSRLWIVVVDTDPATFFFAATPKESSDEIALVDAVVTRLTVA